MTEHEYKVKLKELGWSDEDIAESVKTHNEAVKNGINMPYEMCIEMFSFEKPIHF